MRFTVQQAALSAELDFLGPLLPSQIDEHLRWLTFSCTDSEFLLRAATATAAHESRLPLAGDVEPGTFKIATPVARQLIALLPAVPLTFTSGAVLLERPVRTQDLSMTWPGGHAVFRTSAAFARGPGLGTVVTRHDSSAADLAAVFEATRVSWADDSNAHVPGVLLELGEHMRVVATDGTSLSVASVVTAHGVPATYLLCKQACEHIVKLVSGVSGPAVLEFDATHLRVAVAHRAVIVPLVVDTFMAWERFLVHAPTIRLDFARDTMTGAIRRALMITDDHRVAFHFRSGEVDVATSTSTDTLPLTYDGAAMTFTFNGVILAKLFAGLGGDRIEMIGYDPTNRVSFRTVDRAGTECVLMPMLPRSSCV